MRPFESFPIFLFLLVLAQMHKLLYSRKFGVLVCTDKKEMLDGVMLFEVMCSDIYETGAILDGDHHSA